MNSDEFRKAAHAAIDQIIDYNDTISDRKVIPDIYPGYLRPLLPDGPPQEGEAWEDIQKDLTDKIMPGLTHWQSPNFLAFFPSNTTYPGMLGELYSSAFTAAAFNWICSPAVTELETIVLDWLCKLLNLPPCYLSTSSTGGGGVIQGSASEAVLTVMVAARDRYLNHLVQGITDEKEREQIIAETRGKLVALGSSQAHSCTQKAALIAGVRFESLEADEEYRLRGDTLRRKLKKLRKEGYEPFYLTCSLGTTSTCAIDAFDEIAEVAQEDAQLWIHVDAAYAGAALILSEYQHLTASFTHFDSFDMNMHKWLLVPFDASCLFVKSRKPLLDALSITPSFLRNPFSESGLVTDYRDWQIPLGRRFRALKIWFVMRSYGVEGMRKHLRHTMGVGQVFTELVKSRDDLFEIVAEPRFGLTVFRVRLGVGASKAEGGEAEKRANAITKEVYEKVNAGREVYLTSTVLGNIYAIRVVTGSPRAEEESVRKAFELLVKAVGEVIGQGQLDANGVQREVAGVQLRGV
ncbi:pyridoxal phosphate-dependent transferase [Kalaharituber pfeilii]|nr:pyridoxal phosphate-dependent transferase [Kalaharituber pfeilii]